MTPPDETPWVGSKLIPKTLEICTCPCGGKVKVGRVDTVRAKDEPAIFHTFPLCAEYQSLGLNEFMCWAMKEEDA